MLIETRESTVDNPKEFFYPNKYAIYEDSELNGYSVTDASKHSGWSSEDRKILATNVVSSIDNYGKKYFVYIILKPYVVGNGWLVEGFISDTSAPKYVYSYYDIPMFKNMGLSITEIISKLQKRYTDKISKLEKDIKVKQITDKKTSIDNEDIVGELRDLVESYGGKLEVNPARDTRYTLMEYDFSIGKYGVVFKPRKVIKYNLECWEVYFTFPFMKDYYINYLKGNDFEGMKEIVNSVCKLSACKTLTGDYREFIQEQN